MKKRIWIAAIVFFVLLAVVGVLKFQFSEKPSEISLQKPLVSFNNIPRKGRITMLDLGADACIPCKMMAPILSKLEKEYQGRADIIFIDVWKNPDQAKRFKVKAIPTQIFFDKNGKEVDRHVGFYSEVAIVGKLKYLGVE